MDTPGARRKSCVVTGATSGIGLEAARLLAAAGMTVFGIGRTADACRWARTAVLAEAPGADVRFIPADLSSLANVRSAAAAIRSALPGSRLDRLIHNAATVSPRYASTADGYERQFVVNYLAAFLLTRELFPCLVRPAEARIIAVSSGAHRRCRIDWDDLMGRRRYRCIKAYRRSKLALVIFALELNRRVVARFPVRAIGVEPGVVDTDLGEKTTGGLVKAYWRNRRKRGRPPAEAAADVVRLAVEPSTDIPAEYWRLRRPCEPSGYARRVDAALRLWQLSEKLCGTDFL